MSTSRIFKHPEEGGDEGKGGEGGKWRGGGGENGKVATRGPPHPSPHAYLPSAVPTTAQEVTRSQQAGSEVRYGPGICLTLRGPSSLLKSHIHTVPEE